LKDKNGFLGDITDIKAKLPCDYDFRPSEKPSNIKATYFLKYGIVYALT